jgi:hypothetical protein
VKKNALALLLLVFAVGLKAAEVVKVNGEVLSGSIEDLQLNEYIRIRTKDQKLFEVRWDEIRKLNGKEVVAPTAGKGVSPSAEAAPSKREFWQKGWYLDLFEAGPARLRYPSEMSATMDTLRDLPGADSPGAMSLQMLGIYWPVGVQRQTLLGFIISGASDPVIQAGNIWELNQYLDSFSALYFPRGKIGDGLYLRGDVGFAEVVLSKERASGLGFLTGLGYVMPVSNIIRPFVNLNYSLKLINNGSPFIAQGPYQSVGLDFGLLW